MQPFEGGQGMRLGDGVTRRGFLRAGALGAGAVGLSVAGLDAAAGRRGDGACILLFLVGGPSQLDTWDLKPDAPSGVRGPFRPVRTSVPGVAVCEHFPLLAGMAQRYAVVRSLHHDAAPVHETGHQLLQTGRLARHGVEHPNYGAVLSHLRGGRPGLPAAAVLPAAIGNTGVSVGHGQDAGYLEPRHEPFVLNADPARGLCAAVERSRRTFGAEAGRAFDLDAEKPALRDRYGRDTFGQSCLLARRLIEHGVGLVTVNMFDTVFDRITWDCHADGGALSTRLEDYRDVLCPLFDRACSALLDDLDQRGLLGTTLVVATGEFGRTPHLNPRGGRDHWPGVWSALFAGGGVRGGQVVGSSDRLGGEPRDRPVRPAEVAGTIYHALGLDPAARLPGPDGQSLPLADAGPVAELYR